MQGEAGEDPDRHQRTGQSRQQPCQLIAAGMPWRPGDVPDEPVAWADQIDTGEVRTDPAGATNARPAKPKSSSIRLNKA